MTLASGRRSHRRRNAVLALGLAVAIVGVTAISTDTLGAGHLFDRAIAKVDRILAGPVPERSNSPDTILVADPSAGPEALDPDELPLGSASPVPGGSGPILTPVPVPTATATPAPPRVPVNVDIVKNHDAVFAHELKVTWCASAGVEMVLATLGLRDTSNALQRELQGRVREWESYTDSHNGDWGPSAMALALDAYGAKGYEVRAYKTRQGALRDAARAIEKTKSPVILLAWKGAHTWVMTGFKADADPRLFSDARISGTYILDPWYPDVSSIWGPS
ncbi:MAG: papain-like cysteine protease family protein, partial [Chloroflexota bacterium]